MTRVSLLIQSHLSDVLIEMNIPQLQEQAQERLEFVKWLVHMFPETDVRVDADVVEKLIQTDSAYANLLTEEQSKSVKELFEKAINNKNYTVEVQGLTPEEMPVTITMEEWMRRMKDMAQTGGGPMSFYGSLPDSYKVAINGNHPMVDKVLKAESEEEKERLAKQAFDLALLSQGLLTGKDLTAFVKRSVEMI